MKRGSLSERAPTSLVVFDALGMEIIVIGVVLAELTEVNNDTGWRWCLKDKYIGSEIWNRKMLWLEATISCAQRKGKIPL